MYRACFIVEQYYTTSTALIGCHSDVVKMAEREIQHGIIAVHSPELCDEIFGLSREDTVRSKVRYIVRAEPYI